MNKKDEEMVEEALQALIKKKPELAKDAKKLHKLRKLLLTLIKTDQMLKKEVKKMKGLVEQNARDKTSGYIR